jgi:hypothetical protein
MIDGMFPFNKPYSVAAEGWLPLPFEVANVADQLLQQSKSLSVYSCRMVVCIS